MIRFQVLCGTCSGRILVELANDASAGSFMTSLRTAVAEHDSIDTAAADAAAAERTKAKGEK